MLLTMRRTGEVGTSGTRPSADGGSCPIETRNGICWRSGARLKGATPGAKIFWSRKLLTGEGERNALLNETRNAWSGAGLNITVARGENTTLSMLPNLSARPPSGDAEAVLEVLLLEVGAELVAILGARRQRDLELVAARVAAVGEDVLAADHARVADLDVEGLGVEVERHRLSVVGSVSSRFGASALSAFRNVAIFSAPFV